MKYHNNMTKDELEQFEKEWQAIDNAYSSAFDQDAKMQSQTSIPDEWEDSSDYIGMGWIDSKGRP
jgi:hypothetical protein